MEPVLFSLLIFLLVGYLFPAVDFLMAANLKKENPAFTLTVTAHPEH